MRKLLLVVVIAALALAGFATTGAAHAQAKKTFTIGIAENSASLDPARGYEQQTSIVHKAIYNTLVTFPADNVSKIVGDLATGWTISDDGLTYTFTLKEGVKFASGNVMTADDVVFSYNRLINIKGNPSSAAGTIASVTAKDAKTVVIKLKAPDPAILAKMVFGAFSVVDAKTVKAQGGTDAADADKTDKAEAWLNANSAGTGAYMLTKWDKNNEMVLVPNPNAATKPAFDQIIFKDMPKAATQKAALEAGDVDLALDLSADQIDALSKNPDLTVYQGISPIVFFLLMNHDKAIGGAMSNLMVQKAVRLAIDYKGLVKLAGASAATPGSLIPLGFAGAYTTDQAIKQDVEAAKKLIADSGEKDIKVDLSYPDFTYQGINIGTLAQKVQSDLKAIGITVNLKGGEVQVALAGYRDGKDAFSLWFWGPDFIDALNYAEFLPGMKVGKRAGWTDANSDAKSKELRDAVLKETDATKRAAIFADIQKYWQESGPFAPLVQPGIQIVYRKDLKGFAYNTQWIIDPSLFSR
jgi:peptide/nickel transport system substrate-binding protein